MAQAQPKAISKYNLQSLISVVMLTVVVFIVVGVMTGLLKPDNDMQVAIANAAIYVFITLAFGATATWLFGIKPKE